MKQIYLYSEILTHLLALYGEQQGNVAFERLSVLIDEYRPQIQTAWPAGFSEKDALLITYADQVRQPGQKPLAALADFCQQHLYGRISGLHILPFYPSSSDDGFSVIDYRQVEADFGSWEDIVRLDRSFRLMFDAVVNHASVQSAWFQGFLQDEPPYRDYFIQVEGSPDLSGVVRPRALPLLTRFDTPSGLKQVWTTFSADQADLNFYNPQVLLETLELLLFYAARGASLIRLDAIGYLWKKIGTGCLNLPQTHRVVQLMRAVLEAAAPHVALITETNVPHDGNIAYFGDGTNEAHLVYNFALPPLVLHTLLAGDARALTAWAQGLKLPSEQVAFFNFLASHDGIGLNPVRGILSAAEINALASQTLANGGRISYKHNPDGSQTPYELNINYLDALGGASQEEQVGRFMVAHSILLSLAGLPGIYFHSLFGSRGWPEGVQQTGMNRTINRQKLERESLERELADPQSLRSPVFGRFCHLLEVRRSQPAFNPRAAQQVLEAGPGIFAVVRSPAGGAGPAVLCLHNVTARQLDSPIGIQQGYDLLSGRMLTTMHGPIRLEPYEVVWLKIL